MKKYSTLVLMLVWVSLTAFAQEEGKVLSKLKLEERHQALKINLLSPFYGTVNLAWQKRISNDASFQITATYMDFDSYGSANNSGNENYNDNHGLTNVRYINATAENPRTQGFTITPEYRFVLNGRGLSGVYIAPFMRYMYYEYSHSLRIQIDTGTYVSSPSYYYTSGTVRFNESRFDAYHTLGLGVIIGKQFVFKNRVVIDLFGGPVYSILVASNKTITKTGDVVIGNGIPNTYVRGYGVRAGLTVGFLF
jgi:hypothetical protein